MHLKSACYRIACLQFILQMSSTRDILFDQLSNCCADGPISYCEFIDKVLYTKKYGYYTSERKRVGRGVQGDFYTAESLGSVFAELVVSSVQAIIGESLARESCFIEILKLFSIFHCKASVFSIFSIFQVLGWPVM